MNQFLNKSPVIDFYIEQGYTLFPLNGKVPPKDFHWREAEFNPFFEAKNNFGVQLSASDLVVDVDPRNFKDGVDSYIKFCEATHLHLIATLTVVTGTGGKHYYFKKPAEFKIRKNLKEYPGLDFISEGGYVVGAGSIHPDTKREYVLQPDIVQNTPLTVLELIKKQVIELKKGTGFYVDDAQTRERYREFIRGASPAIEGESGDRTTFTVAATGRDYGLPPDITFEIMLSDYNHQCQPPWTPEALKSKVDNVYKYAQGPIGSQSPAIAFPKEKFEIWSEDQDKYFHRTDSGKIKMDQHNTALMFSPTFPLEGLLAMDLFSHQIIFRRPAPWHTSHDSNVKIWSDDEALRCRHWLSTNKKYEPSQVLMHEGAVAAAYQYQFHPVKEYFESIVWDGHKRVHNWMHKYLGAEDNDYTRAVGLKVLVACVKRVYEPGCKFDYITVLEGSQRTGKSTAWEILASKPWFGDSAIDITKEWSIMKTFGKLMYEWGEMETFRKAGTQAMKGYLSSSTDTVRLPYNRMSKDIPRSGIFVGTFNPEKDKDIGWLHDTTGNTRYWVIATSVCGEIRNDKLREARDQLWAEAKVLYESGVPIYFEDVKVIQLAQAEQDKRLGKDSWHDAISTWVNAPHNLTKEVFTGDEIFKDCIGGSLERYKRIEMSRISRVMGDLEWIKGTHHHRERNETVRGYRRPSLELL